MEEQVLEWHTFQRGHVERLISQTQTHPESSLEWSPRSSPACVWRRSGCRRWPPAWCPGCDTSRGRCSPSRRAPPAGSCETPAPPPWRRASCPSPGCRSRARPCWTEPENTAEGHAGKDDITSVTQFVRFNQALTFYKTVIFTNVTLSSRECTRLFSHQRAVLAKRTSRVKPVFSLWRLSTNERGSTRIKNPSLEFPF